MTQSDTTDTPDEIELPQRLDHAACGKLADRFAKRRGQDILINAGGVTFLSAMAAEILLRARAEWQSDGTGFAFQSPSQGFLEGLSLLGIPTNSLIEEATE